MELGSTSGEVAGWGIYSTEDRASQVLRYVEMPTVTYRTCWDRFVEVSEQFNVTTRSPLSRNKFCAGSRYVSKTFNKLMSIALMEGS